MQGVKEELVLKSPRRGKRKKKREIQRVRKATVKVQAKATALVQALRVQERKLRRVDSTLASPAKLAQPPHLGRYVAARLLLEFCVGLGGEVDALRLQEGLHRRGALASRRDES